MYIFFPIITGTCLCLGMPSDVTAAAVAKSVLVGIACLSLVIVCNVVMVHVLVHFSAFCVALVIPKVKTFSFFFQIFCPEY